MVDVRADGSLWLIDQESSNGIKLSSAERVREVNLLEGAEFVLGKTKFKVTSAGVGGSEEAVEQTVTRTWRDSINDLTVRAIGEMRPKAIDIAAFHPPLHLKIIRGPQSGTDWTLGYGPRAVGSNVVDLKLDDQSLPGLCFRLIPRDGGILFKNETRDLAKLNGKFIIEAQISNGDVIDLRSTQIQVVFDDIR